MRSAGDERFPVPVTKRLVAQGRLWPAPARLYVLPAARTRAISPEKVKLETWGRRDRLAGQPAMNADLAPGHEDLGTVWRRQRQSRIGAMVTFPSTGPIVHQRLVPPSGVHPDGHEGGAALINNGHELREFLCWFSCVATIAAVNSLAFGGGCEPADGL